MNRQRLFYLAILLSFLVVSILLVLLLFPRGETPSGSVLPSPTPVLQHPESQTHPLLHYAPKSGERIVAKTKNRQPLDTTDAAVRKSITERLQGRSGVVYLANRVRIEYIASADVFQGEIRNTDLAAAKNEAVTWFREQGMSDEGICDLPLIFYLYTPVAQTLRTQNIVFDPLPEGC